MKFSLLVAAFGAFLLSTAEGLKSHRKGEDDAPPCAEDDDKCWLEYFGINCEPTDDACIDKAFADIFKDMNIELPDCAEEDDACWQEWADSQNVGQDDN
jgi:hypothetical protein